MSRTLVVLWIAVVCVIAGCAPKSPEVVVYCALDREFSEPILDKFEQRTGIRVRVKYDTESTKSVALAAQILEEMPRPRCDLFWNNEILHTIRLARAGALQPYVSPMGASYPAEYRSSENLWYGFAARARIMLVNRAMVTKDETPTRLVELTEHRWFDKAAMAKPLFGTTATYVASLYVVLGQAKTESLMRALRVNGVEVLSGNKQVAVDVGAGVRAFGLTDTDDALAEIRENRPVDVIFLDQGSDDTGILLIPNTLALIKGGEHPEEAKQLLEYLLSPEVESALAEGPSGQYPLNPSTKAQPPLPLPEGAKRMAVDFEAAASEWERVGRFVKEEFTVQ
ncbi:MAG: extracellular solute-binding protein [Planctomycetota bacterium]